MQSIIVSRKQLSSLMLLLKESLSFFDKRCAKIIFFDEWSMYDHIRNFATRKKHCTVGTLLDIIEPYIPFRLSEDNFDFFIESVMTADEIGEIDPRFAHKAKLDFIVSLREIEDSEQWEQTFAVCEAIRAMKEELLALS